MSGLIVNFGKRIRIWGGTHGGTEVKRTEGGRNWRPERENLPDECLVHFCIIALSLVKEPPGKAIYDS